MGKKASEVRIKENEAAMPIGSGQPLPDELIDTEHIPDDAEPIEGFIRCKVISSVAGKNPGDPVLVKKKDYDAFAGYVERWDGTIEEFNKKHKQ